MTEFAYLRDCLPRTRPRMIEAPRSRGLLAQMIERLTGGRSAMSVDWISSEGVVPTGLMSIDAEFVDDEN